MNKKIISIILLMAIVFADVSMVNPQKSFADDNVYDVEYNQEEITDVNEKVTDVYIDDVQQSVFAPTASTYAASKSGTWIKASNGKWWYKHADGTYTKNGWEYIDGYWYHFDSNGYMQISWQEISGKWYHFDAYGHMDTGWKHIADYWYYFGSDGAMRLSWQKIDGKDYHFDAKGHMDTGWKYIAGYYYYFGSDGVMRLSWHEISGKWYHFDAKGHMDTGWQYIAGYYYYFGSDGVMRLSWHEISGKWYHFDAKGHMDIGWHYIGNGWYYFESDGSMRTKTLTSGTRTYYFYNNEDFKGKLKSTEINIKRRIQEENCWCWAACIQMVGPYNTNLRVESQLDIVSYAKYGKPGYFINIWGDGEDIIKGLAYASGYTKKAEIKDPLSFGEVVNQIDNNHPFIFHVEWLEQFGGHALVCAGYNLEDKSIRIINPSRGRLTKYYDYYDLLSENDFNGKLAICDEMYIY